MSSPNPRFARRRTQLRRLARAALLALWVTGFAAAGSAAKPEVPVTSLSLSEVLRLYRENEAAKKPVAEPPPLAATVDKVELSGRLLDEAIVITADLAVTVLADKSWVKVPLLRLDDDTAVTSLPTVTGGALAVDEGHLVLLSKKQGSYSFEVELVMTPDVEGMQRNATLEIAPATLSRMRVHFDEQFFRVTSEGAAPGPEGVLIHPRGRHFAIAWERVKKLAVRKDTAPPAAESIVTAAHASLVSTLEGRRITRVLYQLRYGALHQLDLRIPGSQIVEKVYENGVAVPFEVEDGALRLTVSPPRAGVATGTLEVVTVTEEGSYSLSGKLGYELPALSWPVNDLRVELHVPPVFNYHWRGGSLSPAAACEQPAAYSYTIPTPGKRLNFQQVLIQAAAPKLRLDYTVDLKDRYFMP